MPFTLYAYAHTHTCVETFPLYEDGSFAHVTVHSLLHLTGGGNYVLGN